MDPLQNPPPPILVLHIIHHRQRRRRRNLLLQRHPALAPRIRRRVHQRHRLVQPVRPHQQQIEIWTGSVVPEPFEANTIPWERHKVNNAANPLHLEQQLVTNGNLVRYKVAWIGGANVLYDRAKLLDVGGFSWWQRLPPEHAGEEVVVQFLLIRKYGGCGILPSGTYHLGLPTSIEDRRRNATELFEELVKEFNNPAVPMGGKR